MNNQHLRNFVTDMSVKPNRFNRTYTLPRRFKEKFLTTNSLSFKSPSKGSSDSSPVNTCLLTKSVDSLLKSVKYLEQILLKKKYEIISSISTAILECILEIYNLIKLIENTSESTRLKLQLNTDLANFIKWSDSVLCFLGQKEFETKSEFEQLTKKSGSLTQNLLTSVQNLVDFVRQKGKYTDLKEIGQNKTRSMSSSSTSTKIEHTPSRIIVNMNQDNTITKTIETQLDENVVQISTLTRTTNDSNKDIIDHNSFENFFNLDKIALELSEISTIDSNAKCNYLLKQFESFAKEFNLNEKTSTSCYSTLNRSKNSSNYSSPSHSISGATRKKVVYKNSKFIHDSESKIQLKNKIEGSDQCAEDMKSDSFSTHKINFIETNYLNDKKISKILLDQKQDSVEMESESRDSKTPERESSLKPEIINCQEPKLEKDLNPEFLLIDDDDDEEKLENLNDDVLVVLDSKNVASFSSSSVSNSSLSILPKLTINDTLNVDVALNESSLSISQSPVQSNKTDNLQSESSLSESSNISNNSHFSPNSQNILSLLDVSHLLEYQSSSSISAMSSPQPVTLPNSAVLRGGEIDALIVLATSANSSVIAPPANNSSHSLTSNFIKDKTGTNFLFQEAFLTTYRTILEPIDLVKKLIFRYRLFTKKNDLNNNMDKIEQCFEPSKINRRSYEIEYNDKFDLNRLKSNIRLNKMTSSAVRNSLTLMVRVLDGLR